MNTGRVVCEKVNGVEVRSIYAPDGRAEMTTSLGARVAIHRDALGQPEDLFLGVPDGFKSSDVHFERDTLGLESAKFPRCR